MKSRFSALLLLLSLTAAALSAPPPHITHEPPQAPVIFVRVLGPEGMSVGYFEGGRIARTFQTPAAAVGLFPGAIYRLQLSNLPNRPDVVLYPSIEVRGTLRLPPSIGLAAYPAPIVITEDDIDRAAGGTFVTKVIVLEDPDMALDTAPPVDRPSELDITSDQDPLEYAALLGRPLLIVRIGLKEPEPMESLRVQPGMLIYPGEPLPPGLRPYFDPTIRLSPRPEEVVRDGGDRAKKVHQGAGGHLQGLDPSDAVAEFTDLRGRRQIAITNEVCILAPRYVVVRHGLQNYSQEAMSASSEVNGRDSQFRLDMRHGPGRTRQREEAEYVRATQSASATVARVKPLTIRTIEFLDAVQLTRGPVEVKGETATIQVTFFGTPLHPCHEGGPLQVIKRSSHKVMQIGDVVTFHLEYSNLTGQPLKDIALTDSLTSRLQYIPGSARSDREADFVTQDNEAGSLILRWEIRDPLPAGKKGVVSFQARIR